MQNIRKIHVNFLRKLTFVICIAFLFKPVGAQISFEAQCDMAALAQVSTEADKSPIDIGIKLPANYKFSCTRVGAIYMVRQYLLNGFGEWEQIAEYEVETTPRQYFADNPNSFLYQLRATDGSGLSSLILVRGNYLLLLDKKGRGSVYFEKKQLNPADILKEAFDVIQPDGKTIYHYNHSTDVGAWHSSILGKDQSKLVFLAPEEGADYRIIDSNGYRQYLFAKRQPYSSLLLKEYLADARHFSGDTFIIYRDHLRDKTDIVPKQFRYMWYYPDNIEMLSYTAECNGCEDENWGNWETGNGMLLFTCNNIAQIKLTVKYRLKKSPKSADSSIVKKVHDTVYIDKTAPKIVSKERKVVEKESFTTKSKLLTVAVWDNAGVDGDIITLTLNGKVVLDHLLLDKCHPAFQLNLEPGENILVMKAENLGTSPPNTASFMFTAPGFKKNVVLRADLGYSESVKIVVE